MLDENTIANQYKGKSLNPEETVLTINGRRTRYGTNIEYQEYIAYCSEFEESEREMVGIGFDILDDWEYNGVDFRVYLEVIDGRIDNCYIYKFVERNEGAHGKPQGSDTDPTQEEILIFKNIMDYATAECNGGQA